MGGFKALLPLSSRIKSVVIKYLSSANISHQSITLMPSSFVNIVSHTTMPEWHKSMHFILDFET